MMMIPGCVDAFKGVAAKLPVASFLFNFARGFNTRLRVRLNATSEADRFQPPPIHTARRRLRQTPDFIFSLDLDSGLW
jgi:hypothetical protein